MMLSLDPPLVHDAIPGSAPDAWCYPVSQPSVIRRPYSHCNDFSLVTFCIETHEPTIDQDIVFKSAPNFVCNTGQTALFPSSSLKHWQNSVGSNFVQCDSYLPNGLSFFQTQILVCFGCVQNNFNDWSLWQ
jgi:hypothetical protein